LVYTAKIGIKTNKTKSCVLICVHARKVRSSKNAALAFAFTNIQKVVFRGFGGLEATF